MADSIPTLVCTCGNVMKAPGARPGRTGKCPKCGALIKVQAGSGGESLPSSAPTSTPPKAKPAARLPESGKRRPPGPTPPEQDQINPVESEARRQRSTPILPSTGGYGIASEALPDSAFERRNTGGNPSALDARPIRPPDIGPVKAPTKPEKTLAMSFQYPLWSWASIGLLAFLPLILIFVTAPLSFLVSAFFSNSPFVVPAYISLIPLMLVLTVAGGYAMIYLGNILVTSAAGELIPPRPPGLDDDVVRTCGRWAWALLSGVLLGGLPAYFYWVNCGQIDAIDILFFFNLTMLGIAYAQLALLATLLHDDPLAANPFTVTRAMFRLGLSYIGVCFFTLVMLSLATGGLILLGFVKNSLVHFILSWFYWLLTFYGAMVVFRRLGLYCHRHKVIQIWFGKRA